jgi:tRNA dimethylallyltransferase
LPACQAIGYRQFADHLDGKLTLEQALEETIRATRRYAKRQETWFRRETEVCWIDASRRGGVERALKRIVEAVAGAGTDGVTE